MPKFSWTCITKMSKFPLSLCHMSQMFQQGSSIGNYNRHVIICTHEQNYLHENAVAINYMYNIIDHSPNQQCQR